MRLFIACLFDDETLDALCALRDDLHLVAGRASYTVKENLHLTLEFLGECDGRQADNLARLIENLDFEAMELVFNKAGCFRGRDGDTWWTAPKPDKDLFRLHSSLMAGLADLGFKPSHRGPYKPHVTLARRVGPVAFHQVHPVIAVVRKAALMLSERTTYGMLYTPLYVKEAAHH